MKGFRILGLLVLCVPVILGSCAATGDVKPPAGGETSASDSRISAFEEEKRAPATGRGWSFGRSEKSMEVEGIAMPAPPAPAKPESMPAPSVSVPSAQAQIPKAGEHDDNEEYQYFIDFLQKNDRSGLVDKLGLAGRRIVTVVDSSGLPVMGATLRYSGKDYPTAADGEVMLFTPAQTSVTVKYGSFSTNVKLTRQLTGRDTISLPVSRSVQPSLPLDIVFLMDTTGSMGDEIEMLRNTIYSIYTRIKKFPAQNLSIRFGIVLYRDQGDEYVTKTFPLTAKIEDFQKFLFESVAASGGGDTPEDLLSGLKETVSAMNWRDNAVKMAFLVTDAPGHLQGVESLAPVIEKADSEALKIFSIGASGLDLKGEIQLRVLSQMTRGKFIFLTYGETGESSGGSTPEDPGKVSHHTGGNYSSRSLDDIVVDNVKNELTHQLPFSSIEEIHSAFDYRVEEDQIFRRVDNALQQLKKQFAEDKKWGPASTVLVLSPDAGEKKLEAVCGHVQSVSEEIFTAQKMLKVVDRSKLASVMDEIKLKLSGIAEGGNIKSIAGADLILAGKVYYVGNSLILYTRLIDASTTEVIAAAMVKL